MLTYPAPRTWWPVTATTYSMEPSSTSSPARCRPPLYTTDARAATCACRTDASVVAAAAATLVGAPGLEIPSSQPGSGCAVLDWALSGAMAVTGPPDAPTSPAAPVAAGVAALAEV